MRLRSGKLANNTNPRPKGQHIRGMSNPPTSDAQQVHPPVGGNTSASNTNKVMMASQGTAMIPSTTSAAVIPQNTNEVMTASQGTATIPSTTSAAVIPQNTNASTISSNTHNEHTIVSMANQNPPLTPRPLIGMSRTFPPGFTIPTSDPIYGMPTSFMTGFQKNTSTYTRPVTSTLSPLQ